MPVRWAPRQFEIPGKPQCVLAAEHGDAFNPPENTIGVGEQLVFEDKDGASFRKATDQVEQTFRL